MNSTLRSFDSWKHFSRAIVVSLFVVLSFSAATPAQAAYVNSSRSASLVIDADTGVVLQQENAGEYRYPASLTKMMTLYLAFEALERGQLTMNQRLSVSSHASVQAPSKLGLKPGDRITAREAVMATVVKSANDAAVVLAEAVAGSEWQFVRMMNQTAQKLGMGHTSFVNASGLHNSNQRSTAYDLARLAIALRRDHPKYYPLFHADSFTYDGRTFMSHNRVTRNYPGADGLKTGYVNASGFNLVTSARRDGTSLVGVVLGGQTARRRDQRMAELLDRGFFQMANGGTTGKAKYSAIMPAPVKKAKAESNQISSNATTSSKSVATANKASGFDTMDELIASLERDNPFAKIRAVSQNRVFVNNRFVPLPLLKPASNEDVASLDDEKDEEGDQYSTIDPNSGGDLDSAK